MAMPSVTRRKTGEPDPYAIPRDVGWPSDLEESRRRAFEEEWRTGSKRLGITYRDLERRLGEQAAQAGFYGAGAHATKAKQLALEEAAARIGLSRDIAARQSGEQLSWAEKERAYQQQLGAMGAGYGYQSQLLGQQQAGTKEIEQMKADLARQLQSQGLSYQDAWKEAERQLQSRGLDIEQYKADVAKELQSRGYDIQEAKYLAELEAQKYMQQQALGWEYQKFYGPGMGTSETGGFPVFGGGGGTSGYGGLYGLQERELALKEAALQQQALLMREGWSEEAARAEAQRMWQTGERMGTQEFQQAMQDIQNQFAMNLEQFKGNVAAQNQAWQAFYDMTQYVIQSNPESWAYDEMNYIIWALNNRTGLQIPPVMPGYGDKSNLVGTPPYTYPPYDPNNPFPPPPPPPSGGGW